MSCNHVAWKSFWEVIALRAELKGEFHGYRVSDVFTDVQDEVLRDPRIDETVTERGATFGFDTG